MNRLNNLRWTFRSSILLLLIVLMFAMLPKVAYGAYGGPSGEDDFLVTADGQGPSVAALKNGNFVIAWDSSPGVECQIFDKYGNTVVGPFVTSMSSGTYPAVAALDNGNFVVVSGEVGDITAQIFDASGNDVSGIITVNTYTTNNQLAPSVTGLSNGNFVATWQSDSQDDSGFGVYGQIFDVSGNKLGGEIPVNTFISGNQQRPSATYLNDGGFVIVWISSGQALGTRYNIYAQIFDEFGNKRGDEFLVNYDLRYTLTDSDVATLSNGNFVVVWHSSDLEAIDTGQIFDPAGNKIGSEFQPVSYHENSNEDPCIATLKNGYFVVSWGAEIAVDVADRSQIRAQILDENGNNVGSSFKATTPLAISKRRSSISVLDDGRFVITWDTNADDVHARIFDSFLYSKNMDQLLKYSEDMPVRFDPMEIFSLDNDVSVSMTLSDFSAGLLSEDFAANATSTYDVGLGKWEAWGHLDGVNELLNGLVFTPRANYNSDFNIDVFIEDNRGLNITDQIDVIGASVAERPFIAINTNPLIYNCSDTANIVDSSFVITKGDRNYLYSAKVSLEGNFSMGVDSLDFVDQSGITGSYNDATGELTLVGKAIIADYQTALRTATYTHTGGFLPDNSIAISFVVNDGANDSNISSRSVSFGSYLHASNIEQSLSYIEDMPIRFIPIEISSLSPAVTVTMTLSDVEAGSINEETATGAASTFNLGIWEASGTVDGVNELLNNLRFKPSKHYNSDFSIDLLVEDSSCPAVTGKINLFGTSVDDNPIIKTTPMPLDYDPKVDNFVDDMLTISSPDGPTLQSAIAKMLGNIDLHIDTLIFVDQNGIVGAYDDLTGELTLTGEASVEDYQEALRSIIYEYEDSTVPSKTVAISFIVNDGENESNVAIRTINLSRASSGGGYTPTDDNDNSWLWGLLSGLGITAVGTTTTCCTVGMVLMLNKYKKASSKPDSIDIEMDDKL